MMNFQVEKFYLFLGSEIFWISILIVIWRFFLYLWLNYFKSGVKWCGGPGTWAVVTGASDGIGLEFVRQLAAKNYNVFLMSRNKMKLDRVKNDLMSEYPNCEFKVMAVDFTKTDIYDGIFTELDKLKKIHVLVNNVGIIQANGKPEVLTKIPDFEKFISDVINVEIITCSRLMAYVLPKMEDEASGIIINLSGLLAVHPGPMMSIAHATKAYIDIFSRGLSEEYRKKGVIIQSLLPGLVMTKMAKQFLAHHNRTWSMIEPDEYVKRVLRTTGRYDQTTGFIGHDIQNFGVMILTFVSKLIGIDLTAKFIYYLWRSLKNSIEIENEKNNSKLH